MDFLRKEIAKDSYKVGLCNCSGNMLDPMLINIIKRKNKEIACGFYNIQEIKDCFTWRSQEIHNISYVAIISQKDQKDKIFVFFD